MWQLRQKNTFVCNCNSLRRYVRTNSGKPHSIQVVTQRKQKLVMTIAKGMDDLKVKVNQFHVSCFKFQKDD